jgi:hypothetical protein
MRRADSNNLERGATIVEMAIAGSVFLLLVFGVIELSRLLWTHNALNDAVRRGARYAVLNAPNSANVRNIVVYGTTSPPGGAKPVVSGLTTGHVAVTYNNFGIKQGEVKVSISGFSFAITVPLVGANVNMGTYSTTLTGEAAGFIPPTI